MNSENIRAMLRKQALDDKRSNFRPIASSLTTYQFAAKVLTGAKLDLDLFSAYQDALAVAPPQLISPDANDFRFACQYFTSNPSMIRTLKVESSENSQSSPFLAALNLRQISKTPFGWDQNNNLPLNVLKSAMQLSQNIIEGAYNCPLSGYDYLNVFTNIVAPADITLNFTLGIDQRVELRDQLATPDGFVSWGQGGVERYTDGNGNRQPAPGEPMHPRNR